MQLATLPESKLWTGEAWDSEQGPTSTSEGSRAQDKPAGGDPGAGTPAGGDPAAVEPTAADEAADKLSAAPEQPPGAAPGSARRSKAGRLRQASAERDSPSVRASSSQLCTSAFCRFWALTSGLCHCHLGSLDPPSHSRMRSTCPTSWLSWPCSTSDLATSQVAHQEAASPHLALHLPEMSNVLLAQLGLHLQAGDDASVAAAASAAAAMAAAVAQPGVASSAAAAEAARRAAGIRERKGLSLAGRIQQSFQREDSVLTFGKVCC